MVFGKKLNGSLYIKQSCCMTLVTYSYLKFRLKIIIHAKNFH